MSHGRRSIAVSQWGVDYPEAECTGREGVGYETVSHVLENAGQDVDHYGTWEEPYGGEMGGGARFSLLQQQETFQNRVDQAVTEVGVPDEGHEGSRSMMDDAMNANGHEGGIVEVIEGSEERIAGVNCVCYNRTK